MQVQDIQVLLLEDGDDASAALNRIDEALVKLSTSADLSNRVWTLRLGRAAVTVSVTVRNTLDSIRAILSPTNQSEQDDRDQFDLILLDNGWEESGGGSREGLDQLQRFGWRNPTGPLLVLFTGHADFKLDYIGEALGAGASALIWKREPVHLINLLYFATQHKVWRAQLRRSHTEVLQLLGDPKWSNRIVSHSDTMQATLREIVSVAAYDHLPVVLEGEVGTGKTLLAELIHGMSRRSNGPFISAYLNQCAPELVASELLGITKGAATGVEPRRGLVAAAEGGTLFLDELQVLSIDHQEIIKNVIERKRYRKVGDSGAEIPCNVRFVLATNEPIEALVESGRMKRDFARRIDVATIRVPSLTDRLEDVPALVDTAIARWCADIGHVGPRPKITKDAIEYISSLKFPDNVGGLFNCVMRACIRSAGEPELRREHFDLGAQRDTAQHLGPSDFMELARLGPRDKSSQRAVFDLLVSASPSVISDGDLMRHIQGDKGALQTVISRLNSRLAQTPYCVRRDKAQSGYLLVKEPTQ